MSCTLKLLTKIKKLNLISHASITTTSAIRSKALNIHVTIPQKNDRKDPIVLLLGWAGCQDRHLKKYSKIYEDRDLITVRYTAPVTALFFRTSQMWKISESILKTIDTHQLQNRPILIHTFSNGGAYCFRYILSLIQKSKRPVTIKGQIFDSGPCGSHLGTFFDVMREVIGQDKFYSSFLAAFGIIGVITLRLMQYPFYGLTYVIDPQNWFDYDPYRALMRDKMNFPQLFLYSKVDKLMPFEDVERFAEHRKSLGVDTKCHCFDGSPHVLHYMMFPKLYTSLIDQFLNDYCRNKE